MLVACNLHTLSFHGVIQELVVLTAPALKYFLNHMIAVDVFAHFFDSVFQVVADHVEMNILTYNFNDLLHRSCPVGVFAELNWLNTHLLDYLN